MFLFNRSLIKAFLNLFSCPTLGAIVTKLKKREKLYSNKQFFIVCKNSKRDTIIHSVSIFIIS